MLLSTHALIHHKVGLKAFNLLATGQKLDNLFITVYGPQEAAPDADRQNFSKRFSKSHMLFLAGFVCGF